MRCQIKFDINLQLREQFRTGDFKFWILDFQNVIFVNHKSAIVNRFT